MKREDRADEFMYYWQMLAPEGSPQPEREFRFLDGRKYRFDFAFVKSKVAIEIDGGTLMVRRSTRTGLPVVVGRHNLDNDRIKMNLAAEHGWRVLHYTPTMLHRDPHAIVRQAHNALAVVY